MTQRELDELEKRLPEMMAQAAGKKKKRDKPKPIRRQPRRRRTGA